MKNPNGYGSVVKLSGNRRKPYAVRKTVGYNDKGHPIYKAIGYAETRQEGLIMLAEYNKNPYDIDARKITVSEVYEKWLLQAQTKLSAHTLKCYRSAYNHCHNIHSIPYSDLRTYHMSDCMNKPDLCYATKNAIRSLFANLDKFAFERDIIDKCYSDTLESAKVPASQKNALTEDEILLLWEHSDENFVDVILVLIYSGWRFSELLALSKSDIDLESKTMTGGTKTDNGKNRIVPIHHRILPFIEKRVKSTPSEFIFNYNKNTFRKLWDLTMDSLGISYTPHECRHTFRSRLDSASANKVSIDLLMGHKSKDVGERVYTHKTIAELRSAIDLLN